MVHACVALLPLEMNSLANQSTQPEIPLSNKFYVRVNYDLMNLKRMRTKQQVAINSEIVRSAYIFDTSNVQKVIVS